MSIRTLGILAMLIALITAGLSRPPVRAQSSCPVGQCVYLPLVHRFVPVRIVNYQRRVDLGGPRWIEGTIQNVSSSPVYSVTLEARFYDTAGQWVGTTARPTAFAATFPGETNYFQIPAPDDCCSSPDQYQVMIKTWSLHSPVTYAPVTVASQHISPYDPGHPLYVSGLIRNDQPRTLSNVRVLVRHAFAALSHTPPVTEYHPTSITLAPGEGALYYEMFGKGTVDPSKITVQAQGMVVP